MADAIFEHARLVEIYDPLDADRSDLTVYADLVDELGAEAILDVGCGTGTFACLLAARGKDVIGVDPAAASIDVARRKPDAHLVRWLVGDATSLPPLQVDLAVMTGNVAQVFVDEPAWRETLRSVHAALRPGGTFVFEVRDPGQEAWREWNRDASFREVDIPEVGVVQTWVDLTDVAPPLVSFRWTFVFASDGYRATSDSTLRFRSRAELDAALAESGFAVREVRDAPDRPGREWVYVAVSTPTA